MKAILMESGDRKVVAEFGLDAQDEAHCPRVILYRSSTAIAEPLGVFQFYYSDHDGARYVRCPYSLYSGHAFEQPVKIMGAP